MTRRSLVRSSPTDCVASLCAIQKWDWAAAAQKIYVIANIVNYAEINGNFGDKS